MTSDCIQQIRQSSQLLTRQQVESILAISCATLYRGVHDGIYPRPIRIGRRAVRWRISDLLPLIQNGLAPDLHEHPTTAQQ